MASSILLQKPEKAANAVFADNKIGLIWTACWWLMTYCPGDVPYKVFRLPPFRIAAKVRSCATQAHKCPAVKGLALCAALLQFEDATGWGRWCPVLF